MGQFSLAGAIRQGAPLFAEWPPIHNHLESIRFHFSAACFLSEIFRHFAECRLDERRGFHDIRRQRRVAEHAVIFSRGKRSYDTRWYLAITGEYSGRPTDRQTDVLSDGKVDRQTDGKPGRHTDKQSDGRTDKQTESALTHAQMHAQTCTNTNTQPDINTRTITHI